MRLIATPVLVLVLLTNTFLPCGPGYVTPLFDTSSAPENPYTDFAAGRLGIIKPKYHRSVLIAAYRYIVSSGLSAPEQQAIVQVWKAELLNEDFTDNSIDEALKAWLEARKKVELKEEKPPEIYAERSYGGYEFFPNCTKNAFETAAATVTDRATAHGPSDPNVVNWVKAQDDVFSNCSTGKKSPGEVPIGAPGWLQKDRAYQKAASEFYSMDYDAAKKHFSEISLDTESPWQETAAYLVIRTVVRQASLTKDPMKANDLYDEAEVKLRNFVPGKFADSVERMNGLIAYRHHPKERVSELAKKIAFAGGNDNFRQDVIDYCWLLDKFESEILKAADDKKAAEEAKKTPANSNLAANYAQSLSNSSTNANRPTPNVPQKKNEDDLEINLYIDNNTRTIYVPADSTDAETIAAAERSVGKALTEEQKNILKDQRQSAYASRFLTANTSAYEGGYYGEERLQPGMLADFLRQDDLTDWLFAYQMTPSPEAYIYALNKYKEGNSDLWLMTALSKADKTSTQLPRLLDAASRMSHSSPAYPTLAYEMARLYIEQGKRAEAAKIADEMLDTGDQLPVSTRNTFIDLKRKFVTGLDDFITYSLKKPYAFDFSGEVGTIDEFIARQKSYYDPEVNKDGREAYEKQIEADYQKDKLWQGRQMFDDDTVEIFNMHFSTQQLIEAERSPALPDYLRERFATAIWMRAFLLDDLATLLKITPDVIKDHPEFAEELKPLIVAKTLTAQDHAILYFVLKHPMLTPYLESGLGRSNDEQEEFDADDWWCAPYEDEETQTENPREFPARPAFITPQQGRQAQTERKRLKDLGDAPKYLAEKVMDWARRFPTDKRVPEALYIVIKANGWTKYGCGNNDELRDQYAKYLKARYPSSEWTRRLEEDEKDK